ncbi:MAG: cellulose binding domain-containing protein [Eubacterium sp.]|nr:cellulose binding domain-containing protein [Eubacterium sp.]
MRMLKSKRVLAVVLVCVFCINTIGINGFVHAEESAVLGSPEWDGETREVIYSNDSCIIKMTLRDYWNNGYNMDITIDNTSDKDIDSWSLEMMFNGNISNIWGASVKSKDDSKYIIKNVQWNQDIKKGQNVSWGFTGSGCFNGFPSLARLVGKEFSANEDDYNVMYRLENEWADGFTSSIIIFNDSNSTIEDWSLEFDYNRDISEIWNGIIISHDNCHYIIKNAGHNSNISQNDFVMFGFNGNGGNSNDVPKNLILKYYDSTAEKENTDITHNQDDNESIEENPGAEEEVSESTNTDAVEEGTGNGNEIEISVDTDSFFYNEVADYYVVDKDINSLTGGLIGYDKVEEFSYEIKDLYDNVVKSDDINISKEWAINKFGLVSGLNELVITAKIKNDNPITKDIWFFNTSKDMEKKTNVDLNDSDNDGLCNYYELRIGTDSNDRDTDGDKLSDYEEYILLGTNPLLKDTDNNGIFDSDEDFDEDELTNYLELKHDTYPYVNDSDCDGAKDGEEIDKYHTNPLVYDSDGDALSDYEDILLGFDPNKYDTDNDGIKDGQEKVKQTIEKNIDNNKKPGLAKVEVETEINGYIDNATTIIDAYNLDIVAANTVGCIGVPVDIKVDAEFDKAKLVFYYTESELGDTSEDDLALVWHDTVNDELVLLSESVVDKENNTVSYITNHFSTYVLVDKNKFTESKKDNKINSYNGVNVIFRAPGLSSFVDSPKVGITEAFLDKVIKFIAENDLMEMKAYNGTGGRPSNDPNYLSSLANSIFRSGNDTSEFSAISNFVYASMEFDNPKYNNSNAKLFILMCDGDEFGYDDLYDSYIIDVKNQGVQTYLINYGNTDSDNMKKVAKKAGGDYKKVNSQQEAKKLAEEIMNSIKGNPESNGDDKNGNKKLSGEFIFTDGTPNEDGSINTDKMSYLPVSKDFLTDKYETKQSVKLFGIDSKEFNGKAGIHGIYSDVIDIYDFKKYPGQLSGYIAGDLALMDLIVSLTKDLTASDVFNRFVLCKGGDSVAWDSKYTRHMINAEKYINNGLNFGNSAHKEYKNNIYKAMIAAENYMDKNNNEIYFATSPQTRWCGCDYVRYSNTDFTNAITIANNTWTIANNMAAFGTFNTADAGLTAHCTYNDVEDTYMMHCKYFIIDYYDYEFLDFLNEQDALGFARGYELYGYYYHTIAWKKGSNLVYTLPYMGE